MRVLPQLLRTLLCFILVLLTSPAAASEYVTYLHPDIQGSPVVATDEQGQVIWRESYAPWGQREVKDTASANPALGSKTWYTGKEEEASLGLYYYGARWYSADVGQFYSIDPAPVTLDEPRTFGRYHYANNNPIRFVDPDGRMAVDKSRVQYFEISPLPSGYPCGRVCAGPRNHGRDIADFAPAARMGSGTVADKAGRTVADTLPKGITKVKSADGTVFKEVHTPPSRPHAGMEQHTHPNYRNVLPDGTVRTGVSKDAVPVSRRDIIDATRPGAQRTGGN